MKSSSVRKWLHGYIVCQSCSGSWERFMNMCRHHGIDLWKISCGREICFCLEADSYRKLLPLSKKTGVCPRIKSKKGLPFLFMKVRKDWTFYSGFLFFLGMLMFLSSFVWEITYRGQNSYSKNTLEKTILSMGVYPGMKKSRLDCDAIEKQIRQIHPDISWVSAEEKGCVLQISIKEGNKTIVHDASVPPCHLTAPKDGVVESIVANRGTVVVKPGEKVKKGQVLIEGIVPVTDDNNETAEKIPVTAKGDVSLIVTEEHRETIELEHKIKEYVKKPIVRYSIAAGGHTFSIRNPFKQLDNSKKYDILKIVCINRTLHPLELPVKLVKTEYREYTWKTARYSEKELRQEGIRRYQKLFFEADGTEREMVSHEAVLEKKSGDTWLLHASVTYRCHEMASKPVTKKELAVRHEPDDEKEGETGWRNRN